MPARRQARGDAHVFIWIARGLVVCIGRESLELDALPGDDDEEDRSPDCDGVRVALFSL